MVSDGMTSMEEVSVVGVTLSPCLCEMAGVIIFVTLLTHDVACHIITLFV